MKKIISQIIQYLFVLLFAYAALNKWLTFSEFQVQLGQSTLLHGYDDFLSYVILIVELLVAVALCIPKTRLVALYLSVFIMTAFTVYIYVVLHHTSMSTCACTGIFEKMSFETHLWFNLGFVILGIYGIYLETTNKKATLKWVIGTVLAGIALVALLFFTSKHESAQQQDFTRTFLSDPLEIDSEMVFQKNSFYIAGVDGDKIYLGDYDSPFVIIEVDMNTKKETTHIVDIDDKDLQFYSLKTKVLPPYFYLADGVSAVVLRGKLGEWYAKTISLNQSYFTAFMPMDSSRFALRGVNGLTEQSELGILDINAEQPLTPFPELLKKQVDGLFDVDGMFSFSPESKKLVYSYVYRNEYLVMDTNMKLLRTGTTIDTTSVAKINSQRTEKGEIKMTNPDVSVNSRSVVHRDLLFNISNVMGKKESHKEWRQVAVVDVYEIDNNRYIGSFYVNNQSGIKLFDMAVTDTHLYGLFAQKMIRFALPNRLEAN